MQPELENQRQKIVDEMKKQNPAESEDSGEESEDKSTERRRDEMLENMLNTPPDPNKKARKSRK